MLGTLGKERLGEILAGQEPKAVSHHSGCSEVGESLWGSESWAGGWGLPHGALGGGCSSGARATAQGKAELAAGQEP